MNFFGFLTPDRVQAAVFFVLGAVGGGAVMNGHTTQNSIAHVADIAGQKQAQVVHLENKVKVLQKAVGTGTASKTSAVVASPAPAAHPVPK